MGLYLNPDLLSKKRDKLMRYDTNADIKGILKDLERLLKYSWVGR